METFCQGRWEEKLIVKQNLFHKVPHEDQEEIQPLYLEPCIAIRTLYIKQNVLTDGSREMEYIIAVNELSG